MGVKFCYETFWCWIQGNAIPAATAGAAIFWTSVISAHAGYLKAFQKQKASVIIQGNTDDRGTAEYNLALGQRRSEAVKKALMNQGVSESQLEAVSFGKEKPVNPAQTEAAFKENRRADFVYQ